MEAVAVWNGRYMSECRVREHTLRADETEEYGGDGTGPMPTELLVASLATCFVLAIAHAARKREVDVPDIEVYARSFRADGEVRYDRFLVEVRSSMGEGLDRLVEAAKRYCFVSNTLTQPAEIEYRIART